MTKSEELRRVLAHHKRRCPHCQSDKWTWLGAVPITPEELEKYLLVKYRCEKCGEKFLVEEAKRSRYVRNADRCVHCGSGDVERTSRDGADIELYRCRRCNAYMAVGEPSSGSGPVIVSDTGNVLGKAGVREAKNNDRKQPPES